MFKVWPVNMPIVVAFLSIATQWRAVPLADGRVHYQGLDYTAARAGLEMAGHALSAQQWRGVRSMERAAGDALNGIGG